jgi:nitrite reductase/ring-hydroxylating ferredoxin subunit
MCYKTKGIDSMPRRRLESVNCSLIPFNPPENEQPVTLEVEINGELQSLLVLQHSGQWHVYRNACPHQGRRLDYAPGKFLCRNSTLICAAHGAVFAMESGRCVQGPCMGESLLRIDAVVADGFLRLL